MEYSMARARATDKDFEVSEVPEKWKNESAVIICQKIYFTFWRGLTM